MNRRQQQAAQTRYEILRAARRLFARDGYRSTKVTDIAAEAGVSPQTVYDSVGGKAEVLAQIVDGMDAEVGLPERIARLMELTDPTEIIRWELELSRAFFERCGDIIRAAESSGEPQIREVREEGRRRHRHGSGVVIERLVVAGALDLPQQELARRGDILAALCDAEQYTLLVDRYGWTVDAAMAFLERLLVREILDA